MRILLLLWLFCFGIHPLTSFADDALLKNETVQEFIRDMVAQHHFKKSALTAIFQQVKIRQQVIKHVKQPLEKEPWRLYQYLFVNDWRIKNGVVFWKKYASTLKKAQAQYGVPASIIVATIGVESRYGEQTGNFRVIDSLSSLAFSDSPRAKFFRRELTEFLLLSREQHFNPFTMMGSYAGAIGQPQFMPSSYRNYAVNFSGSGKTDLMHNEVDVIGSIANYYHIHGWQENAPVAVRARTLSNRLNFVLNNNNVMKEFPLPYLANLGVVFNNKNLDKQAAARVIRLESNYRTEYWLGFHNFEVIRRYNVSDLYAMAVFQLSHLIADAHTKNTNS